MNNNGDARFDARYDAASDKNKGKVVKFSTKIIYSTYNIQQKQGYK